MGSSTPSTPSSTPSTPSSTGNPTLSTSFHAVRPNNSYVYGVGILAVFAFNTFQPKNKKLINGKQDQPPKRRHLL